MSPSVQARSLLLAVALLSGGCTTLEQWVSNGFKVGPNFQEPEAKTSAHWIDNGSPGIHQKAVADDDWWEVFGDAVLNQLIETAREKNLDLKTAAIHVIESPAQRNIAAGNLLPQSQSGLLEYARGQIGQNLALLPVSTLNVWATGFNASWELDLLGPVAARRRIEQPQIRLFGRKLSRRAGDASGGRGQQLHSDSHSPAADRLCSPQREHSAGVVAAGPGSLQGGQGNVVGCRAGSLEPGQTESTIPPLVISLRQANDRLCLLLGSPPEDLVAGLKSAGAVPPIELAIGLPADLVQRRPDVRQALREAAAQCAQIGVAEADFLPRFGVSGFIGYTADDIRVLLAEKSFTAFILPSLQWKILNYGRIVNNVRMQDAKFQQKVLLYQKSVLNAGREVEDALVGYLQSQMQARSLAESVESAQRSVELVQAQYREGLVDFNRVFTTQSLLVTQSDQLAVARGNIATYLVAVYRALGGGWQANENSVCPVRLGPPRE